MGNQAHARPLAAASLRFVGKPQEGSALMRATYLVALTGAMSCATAPNASDAASSDGTEVFDAAVAVDAERADAPLEVFTFDANPVDPCAASDTLSATSVRAFIVTLSHPSAYTPLDSTQFETARTLAASLVALDLAAARQAAVALGYAIHPLRTTSPAGCHWVALPGSTEPVGHAFLVVRAGAFDRDLVLEAPHVPFDRHTDEEAAAVYDQTGARALLVAGAQRCANLTLSSCHSNTECSTGAVESDPSHSVHSAFQAFHVGIDADGSTVAIQFHTNLEPSINGDALVSNGIRAPAPGTRAIAFYAQLQMAAAGRPGCLDDASATSASQAMRIQSCNLSPDPLTGVPKCGVTSTQALASNHAADTCSGSTTIASDRFVHVEQCSRQLDNVSAWSDIVARALSATY